MHLSEGKIKAYQDGELSQQEQREVNEHIETCQRCQELANTIAARSEQIADHLTNLSQKSAIPFSPVFTAQQRLSNRLTQSKEKENLPMFKNIFARSYRPAWIALGVILLLVLSMAFAPVRTLANSFLGLFRVQQVSVVEVDAETMQLNLGNSTELEALISENVIFEGGGDPISAASAQEAAAQAGFSVRLPQGLPETVTLDVAPGGKASFQVDLARVNAVLQAIDRSDIQIPNELDGSTVTVTIPSSVIARYQECKFEAETARAQGFDPDDGASFPSFPCPTLIQMPSPTISAPSGLDVTKLGEAYLQILGMSKQEAEQLAQTIDWASTFVIPLPRNATTYRTILVDGVEGTLIQNKDSGRQKSEYTLVWVKDGILYALSGPGDSATAISIADSLR